MSQSQLAQRLNITRQTMSRMEKFEVSGALELKTLKKVANALGCDLGYALLLKKTLAKIIQDQALVMANKIISEPEVHMRLEKQGTSSKFQENAVRDLAADLLREGGKKIWNA